LPRGHGLKRVRGFLVGVKKKKESLHTQANSKKVILEGKIERAKRILKKAGRQLIKEATMQKERQKGRKVILCFEKSFPKPRKTVPSTRGSAKRKVCQGSDNIWVRRRERCCPRTELTSVKVRKKKKQRETGQKKRRHLADSVRGLGGISIRKAALSTKKRRKELIQRNGGC